MCAQHHCLRARPTAWEMFWDCCTIAYDYEKHEKKLCVTFSFLPYLKQSSQRPGSLYKPRLVNLPPSFPGFQSSKLTIAEKNKKDTEQPLTFPSLSFFASQFVHELIGTSCRVLKGNVSVRITPVYFPDFSLARFIHRPMGFQENEILFSS